MIRPLIFACALSLTAVAAVAGPAAFDRMTMEQYWSGPVVTRALPWSGGDGLTVGWPSDITYVQGPALRIEVTGPKTAVDLLSMSGDVLRSNVQLSGHNLWSDGQRFTIRVTAPDLGRFNLSIGSTLKAAQVRTDHLHINVSTGSRADLAVTVRDLIVTASTGADVRLRGSASSAEVHANTGATADLTGLTLDSAEVHASTNGRATLAPSKAAELNASTNARIRLLTNPPRLRTRASLGARIDTGA